MVDTGSRNGDPANYTRALVVQVNPIHDGEWVLFSSSTSFAGDGLMWLAGFPARSRCRHRLQARLPPPARILPQPGFSLSTLPAPGKRKGSRPYGRLLWFQEAKHIASKTSSVPLLRRYARRGFGTYSSAPPGIASALKHPRLAFVLQLQHASVSAIGLPA